MAAVECYADTAVVRARELPTRIILGLIVGASAWVLAPSPWPVIWFFAMLASQAADWMVFRDIRKHPDRPVTPLRRMLCLASAAQTTLIYSAIAAYAWFQGGHFGELFAVIQVAGGLLHVCLHAASTPRLLIASAVPHAAYFLGLPVASALIGGHGPQVLVVTFAGLLYLAHLYVAVRRSGSATRALKAANAAEAEARARAENASAAKSDFLAVVSHEIRTPMNAVISAAHLLRRTRLSREQEEPVQMLLSAGDVLMGLLNDVLDMSKIEAGKMELESADFQLKDKLMGLARLWSNRAEEKGVSLSVDLADDLPEWVRTDPLRVQQIVANLLSNAVKFTDRGQVVMTAAVTGGELVVQVADTGCGIAKDKLEAIFNSFEQAEAGTTRRYGGSGLGLAISRRLARMMGGSLEASSVPGQGSVFRLAVPVTPVAVAPAPQASDMPAETLTAAQGRRILVAEDHPVNQRILALMLEPLGHSLTFAGNGAEAVAAASTQVFDLILMDMQMPVMDGLEASKAIRDGDGPNARGRIVALTANALGHHRAAWDAVGVSGYLTKPIDPQALMEAVEAAPAQAAAAA